MAMLTERRALCYNTATVVAVTMVALTLARLLTNLRRFSKLSSCLPSANMKKRNSRPFIARDMKNMI